MYSYVNRLNWMQFASYGIVGSQSGRRPACLLRRYVTSQDFGNHFAGEKRSIPSSLQAKTIHVSLGYEMGPFWWKETFSLVRGSRLKRASSANRWETLPIDRSVHQECSSWRTSLFVVTTTRPFAVGGMQFFKGKPTYRLLP